MVLLKALGARRFVTRAASSASAAARGPPAAVRAVPIRLLSVSKGEAAYDAVCAVFSSRLQRYTNFSETVFKPNPKGAAADDVAAQREHEGERLLKALTPRSRLVLLDERGKDVDSLQFAQLIGDAGDAGAEALVFAIGGPFGHGEAMRKRADVVLRLSSLVLNHQVARLLLMEQLYRGWTILKGEGYHHV